MKHRLWSKSLIRSAPLSWLGGSGVSLVFVVFAIILLALSSFSEQSLSSLRMAAADMFSPVLEAVARPAQDAALFVRNVTGLAEMQEENVRLKKENMRLRQWHQAALTLETENKSLRELMKVKLDPEYRFISARILADPAHAFVKSLLVSAGEKDGVKKGQAVVSGDGVIGRIVESGQNAARVLMVSDINSRVPVLIEDTRKHAILAGNGDDLPLLVHLQPGVDIQENARVITSGHGGVFPPGLPVGRAIFDEDGTLRVELYADFSSLIYVRVIDSPSDPNLREGVLR